MGFSLDTSKWTKRDFLVFADQINENLCHQIVFGLSSDKKILVKAVMDDVREISGIIKTSRLTKEVREQLQLLVDDCVYKAIAIASPDNFRRGN